MASVLCATGRRVARPDQRCSLAHIDRVVIGERDRRATENIDIHHDVELAPGDRTVSAMSGEKLVALCEMRAGKLNPVRVFQLT